MSAWCHCGAEQGYPHAADCPFPLFHDGAEQVARWWAKHAELAAVCRDAIVATAAQRSAAVLALGGASAPCDDCGALVSVPDTWPIDYGRCAECNGGRPFPDMHASTAGRAARARP